MRSTGSLGFSLPVSLAAPVEVLPRRSLRVSFSSPTPLLRALGPGEKPDDARWSACLAEWGWAWAVAPEGCAPEIPLASLWLDRTAWPRGFDARALALAVALQLRVDGEPLLASPKAIATDLERVWRTISSLSQEILGEVLALALLRANADVFNFASVAPSWPADVGLVIAERRRLRDEREPAPVWLRFGYGLLGDAFSMVRTIGGTFDDCQEIWATYAQDHELPMALHMAFWWEAAYCLTERHAYAAAEQAQRKVATFAEKLGGFTGLIDSMWHHQQGRLFYYAGNHELALAEFLREYAIHGDDLQVSAMLKREIANVLSDLACLDAARHFAEKSVAIARSQGQRTDLFKSLGRLAEIALKLGDTDGAKQLFGQSLAIQDKLAEDNRSPAQTLTYLGHVAILGGDADAAADWYERAASRDGDRSSEPYITMGRFALAAASGNAVELDQLWNAYGGRIETWASHPTHVLPAAVCILAASRMIHRARERLADVVRALVANRYVIEAAYALSALPVEHQSPICADIVTMLNRWQKTLSSFPTELRELAGSVNGPARMAEAIRQAPLCDNVVLGRACYPMTLIASPAATAG